MKKYTIREWIEEATDLLEQPGLEYTNRERRAECIAAGYRILDVLLTPEEIREESENE